MDVTLSTELLAIFTIILAVANVVAARSSAIAAKAARESVEHFKRQADATLLASFLSKRADVITETTPQFDKLYDRIVNLTPNATEQQGREAMRAFWSFQFQQYLLYLGNYINDRVFQYWMSCRYKEYNTGGKFAAPELKQYARDAIEEFHDKGFAHFILGSVFRDGSDGNIRNIMEEARALRKAYLTDLRREFQEGTAWDKSISEQ